MLKKVLSCPHEVIFFFSVWAFSTLWYGDVFTMAREYSFFSFRPFLMRSVTNLSGGYLWMAGRGLLDLFAFPWLGGLAVAFLLTCGSWLLGGLFCIPARFRALQYLPASAYLWEITRQGFDAFVSAAPGKILGIPLGITLILGLCALMLRLVFHRHIPLPGQNRREEKDGIRWANLVLTLLLPVCVAFYGAQARSYVRVTARLQRLMREQRWEDMIRTAQQWKGSNRQIAAYYAIALNHTGRLLEDLFRIRYDFEPIHLTSRNGKPSDGRDIYESDCNFHAGLLQTAYRKDMELNVLDGVCTSRLRHMIRYAVMKGETNLALRYLYVLSQQPFEKDLVARYRHLAQSPEEVNQDAELAFIRQLTPETDTFESYLLPPTFIGYYLTLQKPANQAQLDAATAAALYTKSMPLFLHYAQTYLQNRMLPSTVGDALGLAYANQSQSQTLPTLLMPYTARLMSFTRDIGGADPQTVSDADHALFYKYRGFYPYYYFFGNRAKNTHNEPTPTHEGGVN